MVADVDETSPLNPSAPENRNGGASYQSIARAADQPSGDVGSDEESATASPPAGDQRSIRTIVAVLLVGKLTSVIH